MLAGRKLKAKAKKNPQNQTRKSRDKSWPVEQLLPAIACTKIFLIIISLALSPLAVINFLISKVSFPLFS